MQSRRFGKSGLDVPPIGMGTWRTFDVSAAGDVAARRLVVDAALETGARLFDSSPMYGAAERVLAETLGARRPEALVATKVWTDDDAEAERQVERALRWYGGTVDVYQVHNLVGWPRRLALLERLAEEGRVRAIGVTHHRHAAFDDLERAMRGGRVSVVQVPYNALDRTAERRLLPLAESLDIGVLVMRPLGEGALMRSPPDPSRLAPLAPFGVATWAQALLKWILSDRRVHCAIPATRDPAHMRANALAGAPPWLDEEARDYVVRLAEGG